MTVDNCAPVGGGGGGGGGGATKITFDTLPLYTPWIPQKDGCLRFPKRMGA